MPNRRAVIITIIKNAPGHLYSIKRRTIARRMVTRRFA